MGRKAQDSGMTKTHMAREVAEIPEAAARFLAGTQGHVAAAAGALRGRDPSLLATVARGSSDHAATYLKYAVELVAGVPVASVGPSIASVYGRTLRLGDAACIAISQSGRSPDIVGMLSAARAGRAVTIAITNSEESLLAAEAEFCLPLLAGPEYSIAATKTCVLSVLAGLALLTEWRDDAALRAALAGAPQALALALRLDWSPLAERLAEAGAAYVLGRGPGYAVACEAALKLKETCALHAEAYSAAEVLHGPAALVQAGFPVLALGLADRALPHVTTTAERLAAQGADVFLTGGTAAGAVTLPSVPGLHPLLAPLALQVAFYAFVEGLARRRGLDPDTPPHLRKVTETV
jgi:glucosamine--fructose-6-phosphate aminotransferase (isomerizing)